MDEMYRPQGDLVGTIFIDFRKVFDMVEHTLLLKKLFYYKISDTALQWFTSYLSTRLQAIKSEQRLSDVSQTLSGVLTNADDSILHVSGKSKNEIEPTI